MRILLLYGTTEGQTRKIAAHIAERLRSKSHAVDLIDADATAVELDPAKYDAAMLAARVHSGRHHPGIERFARRHVAALSRIPGALVSVSMSAARHRPGDGRRVEAYVDRFRRNTGWQPQAVHCAAGARFYARLNGFWRWVLSLVDGRRYDRHRNHEFTDWAALDRFADEWETVASTAVSAWGKGISQSS